MCWFCRWICCWMQENDDAEIVNFDKLRSVGDYITITVTLFNCCCLWLCTCMHLGFAHVRRETQNWQPCLWNLWNMRTTISRYMYLQWLLCEKIVWLISSCWSFLVQSNAKLRTVVVPLLKFVRDTFMFMYNPHAEKLSFNSLEHIGGYMDIKVILLFSTLPLARRHCACFQGNSKSATPSSSYFRADSLVMIGNWLTVNDRLNVNDNGFTEVSFKSLQHIGGNFHIWVCFEFKCPPSK